MLHGVFNLGYFAVRKSAQTLAFLKWWKDFCVDYGMDAPQAGLFVDQKPVDLLPCFIDRLHVLRHPGCNVAWWNIFCDGRSIECGSDVVFQQEVWPLIFYHFSNLDCENNPAGRKIANPLILHEKHQDKVSVLLSSYSALATLFEDYQCRTQIVISRYKEIIPVGAASGKTSSRYVRLLLAEALRRGMQYPGDPALESARVVGWKSFRYVLRRSTIRDFRAAMSSVRSIIRLTMSLSLRRFIN